MSDEIQKEDRDRLAMAVKWVQSTEQGREFLWSVLSFCGVYRDFEGAPEQILKQIGRRQVGLHLMGQLTEASEELFMKMTSEAAARAKELRIKYERQERTSGDRTLNTTSGIISDADDFLGGNLPSYSSGGPVF